MSIHRLQSPDQAIRTTFSAIREPPTFQGDIAVSTNSGALFADHANTSGSITRFIVIQNTDTVETLGIKLIAAGATATGHSITTCLRIPAGGFYEDYIGSNLRVVAVATGALTANVRLVDMGD